MATLAGPARGMGHGGRLMETYPPAHNDARLALEVATVALMQEAVRFGLQNEHTTAQELAHCSHDALRALLLIVSLEKPTEEKEAADARRT